MPSNGILLFLTIGRSSVFLSQPPLYTISLKETASINCFAISYNVSYKWIIESGSFPSKVTGINSSTLVIPNVTSSDENTYTCVATTQMGCVSSSTTQMTVTGMILRLIYMCIDHGPCRFASGNHYTIKPKC